MTTAALRDSVNSLSPAERAAATVQLARLIETQSNILGEPIPDQVRKVLQSHSAASVPRSLSRTRSRPIV